ncbi:MAG TPA: hypothetical protein VF077_05425 [Nitrospiraceae bacterium]
MANAYTNPGGSGNRTVTLTVTSSISFVGTGPTALINGTQGNDTWFSAGQSGKDLTFNFGVPRNIIEAKWYQDVVATHGDWKWQGSNDGMSWTDIGATFTLGSGAVGATPQTITTLSANVDFWRYYRMLQMSGTTSSAPYTREIEFNIDDTVPVYMWLTQMSVEEWGTGNPDVWVTQIVLEQWCSVASQNPTSFSARHV